MKNRTTIGLLVTIIWLATIIAIACKADKPVTDLSLNEVGDFLAGVFSPIAFMWLVIGYFQQGEELQQNTQALQLQADEYRELNSTTLKQVEIAEKSFARTHDIEMKRLSMRLIVTSAVRPSLVANDFYQGTVVFKNIGASVVNVMCVPISETVSSTRKVEATNYTAELRTDDTFEVEIVYPAEVNSISTYLIFAYVDAMGNDSYCSWSFTVNDKNFGYRTITETCNIDMWKAATQAGNIVKEN